MIVFNSVLSTFLGTFVLWGSIASASSNFHVSPTGSDFNVGSSASPFQTLQKAQNAVRAALTHSNPGSITVSVADGLYPLSSPLYFNSTDSGKNGIPVQWIASGSNALISGGTPITGWTENGTTGIYTALVPKGIQSRNLYVNGNAAQYSRRMITRSDFTFTSTGMTWTNPEYDYIMSLSGIENVEIRASNSFTDRYAPVQSVGQRELIMKQDCWSNQLIGYDTIESPAADFGVWIQNSRDLLIDGGQYFLDSPNGQIHYMPLAGENMATVSAYLGTLETLLAIGGTLDSPAHDIVFQNLNFVSYPTQKFGIECGFF